MRNVFSPGPGLDLFIKLSPLCPLRQYPVSYCTAAPAAACWQCWILPVTVEFNYLHNEITRYIIFKYSRGEMTSGMKTGKLERHFSEAFGLLDLHQQIVQD